MTCDSPVRCLQTGWAPGPVTSTLSIRVNLTPYCLKATCLISSMVPGSWPPNWLQGNAAINHWHVMIMRCVTSCLVLQTYCYNWGCHEVSSAPCNETQWTHTRWQHSPLTPPCRKTVRRRPRDKGYDIWKGLRCDDPSFTLFPRWSSADKSKKSSTAWDITVLIKNATIVFRNILFFFIKCCVRLVFVTNSSQGSWEAMHSN